MKHYVGLDVSMKSTSVCIVDQNGNIVHESTVSTEPEFLVEAIQKTGLSIELVGFESGPLGHYLTQAFKKSPLNAVCVDAKKMNAILSVRVNKTDKNDARGIANALRTGMFSRVHEKSQEAIDRSVILAMRRCLVKQRTDLKNHVRGVLKAYGIRLGAVGPNRFSETVKNYTQEADPFVRKAIERSLQVFELLHQQISEIDRELIETSRTDKEVKLLMTAHGVGPITALTYKAEIHDPNRFADSKTVGAYLGMTPTQYQSGDTCKQGRISRCGSSELRWLLSEAGLVVLTRSKKWSKLKAWGLKIARKKGLKKASMAVGRKLAVIMHRMLQEQREFVWGEPEAKAA